MTIAQQVQKDLVKELLSSCNLEVPEVEVVEADSIYLQLKGLGIGQAEQVRKAEAEMAKRNNINRLNVVNSTIKTLLSNPLYGKTITFAKLCKVLAKYNLHIGKASDYIKEIPIKNAKEILEYAKTKRTQYFYRSAGTIPLSTLLLDERAEYRSSGVENLYICGSLDNFRESKDRHTIGREIVYNSSLNAAGFRLEKGVPSPDPIVVNLILTGNNEVDKLGLFDIVTAWDREAADPEILDEKKN